MSNLFPRKYFIEALKVGAPAGTGHVVEIFAHYIFFRIVMMAGHQQMAIAALVQSFYLLFGFVVDAQSNLVGVITDGDLRRHSNELFRSTAADVMTSDPKSIVEGSFCEDALAIMQANRITALFVMASDHPRRPIGLVHIHDLSEVTQG